MVFTTKITLHYTLRLNVAIFGTKFLRFTSQKCEDMKRSNQRKFTTV